MSKTFHWNVFEGKFVRGCQKGERSWSLPLEMLSHFSPLAPFLCKDKRNFAVCGQRQGGRCPLDPPQAFEKCLTETFTFELICAIFSLILFGIINIPAVNGKVYEIGNEIIAVNIVDIEPVKIFPVIEHIKVNFRLAVKYVFTAVIIAFVIAVYGI